MKTKNLYNLILLGLATACSGPEQEDTISPTRSIAAMQKITLTNIEATGYKVSAFRQGENGFTFFNSFDGTDRTGGKMEIELPIGNYRFIFAGGYGKNTQSSLTEPGQTLWEEVRFNSTIPDPATPQVIQESDEVFLQDQKADSIYQINGPKTIQCTLKRAVSQAILYIKRGYQTDLREFKPLPYPNGDSIIRYFSEIQLDILGAGISVDAHSIPQGQGNISVSLPASTRDSITAEGFAKFTGPFFFPAENNAPVTAHVILVPTGHSPQPQLSMTTSASVKRNQQLVVTVWITSDWNFIHVDAVTRPITTETEGENGIWDDHIKSF